MHKYLRAIGFSKLTDRKNLRELLVDTIKQADRRSYTLNRENVMLGEFSKNFADDLGIAVCGEFDEEDKFVLNYYFPYLVGKGISSYEDVSVERHMAKDSYAGVCDDLKVGISLIFYLRNMIQYVKMQAGNKLPVRGTSLTLSALSTSGTIIFPIKKDDDQRERIRRESINRNNLLAAARKGDEDAIETLTLEDMDLYTNISKRILREDVFTLVDTYFMPYGVECDLYSVMGEIVGIRKTTNKLTQEEIFILTICCNELTFDVCINIIDLLGEPMIGRRFKGVIWLQGKINFPDELV